LLNTYCSQNSNEAEDDDSEIGKTETAERSKGKGRSTTDDQSAPGYNPELDPGIQRSKGED
jgi:hypothetical protein